MPTRKIKKDGLSPPDAKGGTMGRPKKYSDKRKQLTLYVDENIAKALKIYAIKNDLSLTEVLEQAVSQYIEKNKISVE